MGGPAFVLQSICERRAAFFRRLISAAFRSPRRLSRFCCSNQASVREFFQRLVNLRPRQVRPIPNLPPLQLQVRLVPVHRPLCQQAQQHQIRRRQLRQPPRPVNAWPRSLRVTRRVVLARSGRLCVFFSLHFFPALRLLLQYHHWHCSTGSRG